MGRIKRIRQTIERLGYNESYFLGTQNPVSIHVEEEGTSSNKARIHSLLNIDSFTWHSEDYRYIESKLETEIVYLPKRFKKPRDHVMRPLHWESAIKGPRNE